MSIFLGGKTEMASADSQTPVARSNRYLNGAQDGTYGRDRSQGAQPVRAAPVAAVQVLSLLQDVLLALERRLAVAHPAGRKRRL